MCLLIYASVTLMHILANTKCHLWNVYYLVAHVFLASLSPKWLYRLVTVAIPALYRVSNSWSWSCSTFPCRQSSHWFPDRHAQVKAAGSVPNVVKIDSYLIVFIKRKGRTALYNRRVFGGSSGLFKTSSDSCFPWQKLALQAGHERWDLAIIGKQGSFLY